MPSFSSIQLQINHRIYQKDPFSSALGKKILTESIEIINEIGLEQFTFKKLASHLGTAESSIYRYFESKHKLLIYLISWYWAGLEYKILLATTNRTDPQQSLAAALKVLCNPLQVSEDFGGIATEKLLAIVIAESSKAYLTKEVDNENKEGFFSGFKQLCSRISEILRAINPSYPYAHSLVATMIEAVFHQKFFAAHLPGLSDANTEEKLYDFILHTILSTVENYPREIPK